MAATPRKFQEKIALINERAAQGTAAYEEIMQQVSSLRSQPRLNPQQKYLSSEIHQLSNRSQYSGSLPDFSINLSPPIPPNHCYPCDSQGAVNDLNHLTQMYPSNAIGSVQPTNMFGSSRPHPSLQNSSAHSQAVHKHNHLIPPEVLSRSSSDSSLHITAYQNKSSNYKKVGLQSEVDIVKQVSDSSNRIPKISGPMYSSVEVPAYNHQSRSSARLIPASVTSANGGSLPDLTQVQYIQPMPNPLPDFDSLNHIRASSGSPRRESPQGMYSRLNGPCMRGSSPGPSPRPSPIMDRKQKMKPYTQPLAFNNQRVSTSTKKHLSVPSVINAHQHMSKGIVTENTILNCVDGVLPCSTGLNIFGRPFSPGGSHPTSPMSFNNMEYRNPSSPQLSPCSSPVPSYRRLKTGSLAQYRCTSPDSRGSAPPSPVSLPHSSSPTSSPGYCPPKHFGYESSPPHIQQMPMQLNHQFQQITMQSPQNDPLEQCDPGGSSASASPTSPANSSSILPHSPSHVLIHPNSSSPSHIPPSPTHPSSPAHSSPISPNGGIATPSSQAPATPRTPLTPSVPLPRLVVTDQDGNDDRDLLSETSELPSFLFDDSIFKNIGSLGEEEWMSVDQILVDTETEESFRRDLKDSSLPSMAPLNDNSDMFVQRQYQQRVPSHPSPNSIVHDPAVSDGNNLSMHQQTLLDQHHIQYLNQLQTSDQNQFNVDEKLQQNSYQIQDPVRDLFVGKQQIQHVDVPVNFSDTSDASFLTSLVPLDSVSETLLSYNSLEPSLQFTHSTNLSQDMDIMSTVSPSCNIASTNANSVNWHQLPQPNSEL